MHTCEVRMLDATGMVVEVHPADGAPACVVTRARIWLEACPEMAAAEVRHGSGTIAVACGTR